MSFDTVLHTLSAQVASAGTFDVAYPNGRKAGDYTGSHAHKLFAMQAKFEAPNDFTVSFGASDITVTYNGATTIPAGTTTRLQFDRPGTDTLDPDEVVLPTHMSLSPLHLIRLGSPAVADPNGYVESQDLTTEGVFSVNVTAAAAIAAAALNGEADVPRNIVADWTTTSVLTFTGEDEFGNVIVENSGSAADFTGKKAFKKLTSISSTEDITGLTVGTGDVLGLPAFVREAGEVVAEYQDGVILPREPGKVYIPFHYGATQINAGTGWFINSPVAGRIIGLRTAVEIAFTTGGAVTVNVGATPVDGLSVTVGTEAADELDSDTATAGHASAVVAVGDLITILGASGFDSAGALNGVLEIAVDPADQMDGTLVAGVTSKATATTGDVRGTYDPTAACNGALAFALVVALVDPGDRGVPQFAG
jgi:hypothetical protein